MKRLSATVIIQEMLLQTVIRYHYTPTRMTKIKRWTRSSVAQDMQQH